jgi:hypothetical protein
VRGIASLGEHAAVFTVGASLLTCDWDDPLAPLVGTVLSDMDSPWGVTVEPLCANQLYVSERDADRVLAIELDSHGALPVVVHSAPLQVGTLTAPEALALEADGSRLLVETDAPNGQRRIEGLNLGGADGNVSFYVSAPSIPPISSLASGRHGLRLASVPSSNELLVAGGIEQQRRLKSYTVSNQRVAVQDSFEPAPRPNQRWRLPPAEVLGSALGVSTCFTWNSSDAPPSAPVYFRATARDDELGPAADAAASKPLLSGLSVDPLLLSELSVLQEPESIATADLDGDGDLDIVTANSGNLTVFFQTSPAVFGPQPLELSDPSVSPQCVATSDLDSDGDVDIVCAGFGTSGLTVFFQTLSGIFDPKTIGTTTNSFNAVAAADLDGDCDQDLATTDGNQVAIYFQIADGEFELPPLVVGGSSSTLGCRSVATGDFNLDGKLDLVTANEFLSTLAIFLQSSPGVFASAPVVLGNASLTKHPTSVLSTDLDCDGDLDIASTNDGEVGASEDDNLTVFIQSSTGTFDPQPLELGGISTTINPETLTAADLDGDGDLDLACGNRGDLFTGDLAVFFQEAPGSFKTVPLILKAPNVTSRPYSIDADDLEGDGDFDLLFVDRTLDHVGVFLQDSPGHYSAEAIVLGSSFITPRPRALATADFDRDGSLDLVSANEGGSLTVFYQTSTGGFHSQPRVIGNPTQTGGPASVAAADLDRDGLIDLVSANSSSDNLTVFLQLASGAFSVEPIIVGGSAQTQNPQCIVTADMNDDGLLDLISANQDGNDLTIFPQDALGGFADVPWILGGGTITGGPVFIRASDIDSDGRVDVVSCNHDTSNLTVFFQAEDGSFETLVTLGGPSVTGDPRSIAVEDADGDGDLDLVSANRTGTLTVFIQISPGDFNPQPIVLEAFPHISPASVAASDFDEDGDIDLLCAGDYPNPPLTIFVQTAPGQFVFRKLPLIPWVSEKLRSLVAADLDKDGDVDFAFANVDGGFLTVCLGGR